MLTLFLQAKTFQKRFVENNTKPPLRGSGSLSTSYINPGYFSKMFFNSTLAFSLSSEDSGILRSSCSWISSLISDGVMMGVNSLLSYLLLEVPVVRNCWL
jgi:hypothetical protein